MSAVVERFLKYIQIDTESKYEQEAFPSTEKQKDLAKLLVQELNEMGASNVRMDEYGYVTAAIPPTVEGVTAYGFIAHMDTSPALSGKNVKPNIIKNYDGQDIVLNKPLNIIMKTSDFPELIKYQGQDLIVTDGTTLLGADDKAGIAEIMTMAEYFIKNPSIPHGPIQIGFTPDEEVGRGVDFFDVKDFGAEVAYTVDGGEIGELEYENFNAASAKLFVHGVSVHPGSSKGKMKNALLMAMEFHGMLPVFDNPMYTEGYEGFFHLDNMAGDAETAVLNYVIRDHDAGKFEKRKEQFQKTVDFLNEKYGAGSFEVLINNSYYNMKNQIKPHMYLIDNVKEIMIEMGIEPKIVPIRGGTDGAKLSYMGLPCPNICTGGHNFHGKFEYIPISSMEKITDLLIEIIKRAADGLNF